MILICPSCSTRYLLSSAAIGTEGRDVRCAKCHHEWYQEPDLTAFEQDQKDDLYVNQADNTEDQEDHFQEEADDYDDEEEVEEQESIPESVKPTPQSNNVPAFAKDVVRQKPTLQARITGYATALMIFIMLVLVFFIYKPQIVSAWPPSAIIYEMAGFPASLKGENLVMETLSATILKGDDGKDVLVLKGRVINLTNEVVDVPQMRAILRSTNGEDGDSWIIDSPVDQVQSGASFAFTSDYPDVPRGVGSVNLTFVPTVIGAEDHKKTAHQH